MSGDHPVLETRNLTVVAGKKVLLRGVNLRVRQNQVFTLVGPSGVGKSTLLRCLNRLIEMDAGLRVQGDVLLDGRSVLSRDVDVDALRARVGILFQQPVVFPVSILNNVLFGVKRLGKHPRSRWTDVAEQALRQSALWDEVKDRFHESALRLSVGQQQRLCLARALAVDPEVLLMDEPTSALDPKSTELVESLILALKATRTVVLVTHNRAQALRVSDTVACLAWRGGVGEVERVGSPDEVLGEGAAAGTAGHGRGGGPGGFEV